jgi:hypothetical protein
VAKPDVISIKNGGGLEDRYSSSVLAVACRKAVPDANKLKVREVLEWILD